MSTEPFPSWRHKGDAIRSAVAWAAGTEGDWRYKSRTFNQPSDTNVWFELAMGRMLALGVDDLVNEDNLDPQTGEPDATNPRKQVVVGQRRFIVTARFYSMDQEQDAVAWNTADRTRTRLQMDYPYERWLTPNRLSLVEMLNVIPMPGATNIVPQGIVDDRWQSEAVLEFDMLTTVTEENGAAIGTWIESVEITSKLFDAGGVLLDESLQLDKELMP